MSVGRKGVEIFEAARACGRYQVTTRTCRETSDNDAVLP
jgi:hypothetical protein